MYADNQIFNYALFTTTSQKSDKNLQDQNASNKDTAVLWKIIVNVCRLLTQVLKPYLGDESANSLDISVSLDLDIAQL